MKKNKKERKYRLFFLLLWLFILGISLSTSSYAWFTSNRLVSIGLMEVEVRAQNGISISSDGTNWKSVLSILDLVEAVDNYPNNINQLPKVLEPVSTIGNVNNGLLEVFHGKVENDATYNDRYNIEAVKTIEERSLFENSDKKFLAFDVFLKTYANTKLYLTTDSGATYKDKYVGIENATRFAFVVEGSTQSTDLNTIQNLKTNSNNNVYIWEPNYDSHTESGILNAKNVYNLDITNNYQELPYEGIKNEIPKNLKVAIDKANKANYPNYFDTVKVSYYTKTNFTDNVEIFSVNQGITKLRIYMWLEGQDVDCENDASVGSISLNLQFSTNPN